MPTNYEPHDYAKIFPLQEGKPLSELADDIKANGLHEPIMIYQGKILDGRRRELACFKAGVEPKFAKWKGTEAEALAWVISKNLHRRHLDESQRAMVAANLATIKREDSLRQNTVPPIGGTGISQGKAAEMLNVSERAVQRAATVSKNGTPKLTQAVEAGEVSVSDAAAIVDESPEVQDAAVEAVKDGKAKTVRAAVKHEANGKAAKEDEPLRDSLGHLLTPKCFGAFAALAQFKELDSLAQQLQKKMDEVSRGEGGEQLRRHLQPTGTEEKTVNKSEHLNKLKRDLKGTRPHAVCPWCKGRGLAYCKGCLSIGWVTKIAWENAEDKLKAGLSK